MQLSCCSDRIVGVAARLHRENGISNVRNVLRTVAYPTYAGTLQCVFLPVPDVNRANETRGGDLLWLR